MAERDELTELVDAAETLYVAARRFAQWFEANEFGVPDLRSGNDRGTYETVAMMLSVSVRRHDSALEKAKAAGL